MAMKDIKPKDNIDIFSSEIFDKTINVNLRGIFCAVNILLNFIIKNIDQRVINIGTIYAIQTTP